MEKNLEKIKMILMDVDGVLTDGRIVIGSKNIELKFFDVQDGMGVVLARRGGLKTGIITAHTSDAVSRRARDLKVDEVWQGCIDKIGPFQKICAKYNLDDEEVAYVGDDIIDIPIMKRCGFSIAVKNARPETKAVADFITEHSGGRGAIRETVEMILKSQGKWDDIISNLVQSEE